MNKIKKKLFFIIKSAFVIVIFFSLALFFYSAFFYTPFQIKEKIIASKIAEEEEKLKQEEEKLKQEEEKLKQEEEELEEKISNEKQENTKIKEIKTTIKDGLFAAVGNKAITKSDILNEMKVILILNNMSYSEDKREDLQRSAIRSTIKKKVKEIAINEKDFLEFNQNDVNMELDRLANRINMDVDTLKNICISNGLDFSIITDQIEIELLWNSLVFQLYKDRLTINLDEIEEQLKLSQNKKEMEEYLISEIVLKHVERDKLVSRIEEIKNKIKIEGFESVAMNLSISQTASTGGDLGWLNENAISKKFRSKIFNTSIGSISEPILINEGILIFKVRDKRKISEEIDLNQLKDQLVNSEKSKILNMYSMTHYDNFRRTLAIKFFNE